MRLPSRETLRTPAWEIVSIGLLGTATLCLFVGYFAHSFVSEAVLHSVHARQPTIIDLYAGYYGQAVQFGVFAISCLVAPSIVNTLSSKGSLILCSVLFAAFFSGYLHINSYFYYFSQVLAGIAYAVFNNAEGAYLSEHSSVETIESNTALETAIGHGGQLLSGVLLYCATSYAPSKGLLSYFEYTDAHIYCLYGSFLILTLISIVIFILLPKAYSYGSLAGAITKKKLTFIEQIKTLGWCAMRPNMLKLSVCFMYQGAFTAFFLAVYPTSFSFNKTLSNDADIVAVYCVFIGIGEIVGGALISYFSRFFRSFSLIPSMMAHSFCLVILQTLVLLSTPQWALVRPTDGPTLLFDPSHMVVMFIGLLVGLCDCSITTARAVICQLVLPNYRMEVFSVSKLYQAGAGCIVFFMSPILIVPIWGIIFYVMILLALASFLPVAYNLEGF